MADYFCRACRTPFRNHYPLDETGLCSLCRTGAIGYDAAYSFGAYEGVLEQLIHLFKYGQIETLEAPLGQLLANAIPRTERFDVVVPMPMHWWRRWRRGFNQAELLARHVARRMGLPLVDALRRFRQRRSQAGLSRRARRLNVQHAFALRRPAAIAGKRVLLVDDVLTTGATASAAARTLKEGGARYVAVLTLARVDRRQGNKLDPSALAAETLSTGVF